MLCKSLTFFNLIYITRIGISVDYTDTSMTANDATIVLESLRKLRDREGATLTESTVIKTQGTVYTVMFVSRKVPVGLSYNFPGNIIKKSKCLIILLLLLK